jgi:3D (Asp-Asp-Asp) domain-containing protein
LPSMN